MCTHTSVTGLPRRGPVLWDQTITALYPNWKYSFFHSQWGQCNLLSCCIFSVASILYLKKYVWREVERNCRAEIEWGHPTQHKYIFFQNNQFWDKILLTHILPASSMFMSYLQVQSKHFTHFQLSTLKSKCKKQPALHLNSLLLYTHKHKLDLYKMGKPFPGCSLSLVHKI